MDKCDLNSFEDIMKACGYCFDEDGNIDMDNSNFNEDSFIGCKDMTGGFQNMYPQLFVLIGEVLGAIISQKLPINIQQHTDLFQIYFLVKAVFSCTKHIINAVHNQTFTRI